MYLLFISFFLWRAFGETQAEQVLKAADEIRNPSGTYEMDVSVENSDSTKFDFTISIGGKDLSLIRTKAPSREIGKNYLMEGEVMWAYFPSIRRSVRVSLAQKLTGQASNGDMSRMRWFGDYEPKIESETAKDWTLILTAKREGLTYEKIRVWVDKAEKRPMRAEFLSPNLLVLKKMSFDEFGAMAGGTRPTKMTISNPNDSSDHSILRVHSMEVRSFSSNHFTQSNLQ
jgi:outer membrane lipoprotein-sorting protein